jgi:hypothetical protein
MEFVDIKTRECSSGKHAIGYMNVFKLECTQGKPDGKGASVIIRQRRCTFIGALCKNADI